MNQLVDRLGRTGFAAVTSLIWALPMAAWAGTADLSPIDKTATPWIALSVGVVMLVGWLVLVSRLSRVPVSPRPRRLDIAQMSKSEKRWILALGAFVTGLIAWLNGAATVDWQPLAAAIGAGSAGAIVFGTALGGFLLAMIAGIGISWRKQSAAFQARRTGSRP